MFNSITIESDLVPKLWKKCDTLKPGKAGYVAAASFRFISLSRQPMKIFERLVLKRVHDTIESSLIPGEQVGAFVKKNR